MSDQFIQINPIQADVWFTQNCQGGGGQLSMFPLFANMKNFKY